MLGDLYRRPGRLLQGSRRLSMQSSVTNTPLRPLRLLAILLMGPFLRFVPHKRPLQPDLASAARFGQGLIRALSRGRLAELVSLAGTANGGAQTAPRQDNT